MSSIYHVAHSTVSCERQYRLLWKDTYSYWDMTRQIKSLDCRSDFVITEVNTGDLTNFLLYMLPFWAVWLLNYVKYLNLCITVTIPGFWNLTSYICKSKNAIFTSFIYYPYIKEKVFEYKWPKILWYFEKIFSRSFVSTYSYYILYSYNLAQFFAMFVNNQALSMTTNIILVKWYSIFQSNILTRTVFFPNKWSSLSSAVIHLLNVAVMKDSIFNR